MKCFDCNHINQPGANFCTQCGKKFKKKNDQQSHDHNEGEDSPTPPVSSVASKLIAVDKEIQSKNHKFLFFFFGISAICLTWAWNSSANYSGLLMLIGIVFLFIPVAFYGSFKRKQSHYIEAISPLNRGHFCYNCGGKGIWRSTIYKTNTVEVKCSRCKTFLWYE
ncbi:hypothetical protein L1267_23365 [Pseudoalteromonas sp. OFAV1]|uniref:hypothetical protein n=1 Tax=Pseudoalteromonas sp. OFAV1 TaxID=2908892 RepID=UPI001F409D02|nr:hypothetical protein [Pseudoalteromonas sp. OFAV1]MCF2903311.1 hypothetical protein [Pseudoalteromonas sp. OFAV1]